jgi:hypothetical protein
MNIRKIVTFNALRRQFTSEEMTLADTLYNATESEKEMIVESMQPAQKAAPKPDDKKCRHELPDGSRCGKSPKHLIHSENSDHALAHKFILRSKSKRASSLAEQIKSTGKAKADDNFDDPNAHCQKEFDGGFTCNEPADANVHHLRGVTGYHEFVAGKLDARNAAGKSSTNGAAISSTPSTEDEKVSAGDAQIASAGGD